MTRPTAEARSHGGGGAGALLMLNGHGNGNGNGHGNGNDGPAAAAKPAAAAPAARAAAAAAAKDDSALPAGAAAAAPTAAAPAKRLTRGLSLFFEIVNESDDTLREQKIRRSMDEQQEPPPQEQGRGGAPPPSASRALPPRPPQPPQQQQQRGSSLGQGSSSAQGASPTTSLGGSLSLAQRSSLYAPGGGAPTPTPTHAGQQQQARLPTSALAIAAAQAARNGLPPAPTMTPAEVLEELLGDLFIDPSRLEEQELLGEGGFAAVHAATLAPPGGGGSAATGATPQKASSSSNNNANANNTLASAPSSCLGGGEPVAVKRLLPDALAGPDELKEFLAEANLLRKMRHPHVVALRGVGSRDLSDFVAMRRSMYVVQERMDAGDLRALVQAQAAHPFRRVYSLSDALRWARQVAAAVHYLHGVCRPMVIHRDLKLDNVLLATPDRGLAARGGAAAAAKGGGAQPPLSAAAAAAEAARGGEPVTREWTAKLADFGLHKRLRRRIGGDGGGDGMDPQQQQQAKQQQQQQEGQWVAWDSAGPSYRGNDYEASFYGANLYSAASAGGGASLHGGGGGAFASLQQQAALAAAANRRMAAERALAAERGAGADDAGGRSLDAVARDGSVRRRAEALRAIEDGSVHGGRAGSGRAASGHSGEIAPAVVAAAAAAAAAAASSSGGAVPPVEATTRVGSLLYMAPEVLLGQPYNEKVDTFSFGVLLYELFSGKPLANRVAAAAEQQAGASSSSGGGKKGGGANNNDAPAQPTVVVLAGGGTGAVGEDDGEQGTLLAYAQRVAVGHREDMPLSWPKALRQLVAACWHPDPKARPSFAEVVRALDALRDSGAVEEMDAAAQSGLRTDYDPLNDCGCGCAIM